MYNISGCTVVAADVKTEERVAASSCDPGTDNSE